MASERNTHHNYTRPIRRIVIGATIVLCLVLFTIWRIDSPRVERLRASIIDRVVPDMDWALLPVTRLSEMVQGFQSYARLHDQNQELRRELRQMKAWKEAAQQLDQENAKLRALNKVRLDPQLTHVTGVVLADSGSPFRQSVLLNVGARDGIVDGWATTDGLGLVGRISGVGARSARVILLSDANSRIPVTIQPSGQRAILSGDNTARPAIEFLEAADQIRPGDRVVSSGDGGVFPAGLLVGQVTQGRNGRLRVLLAADYERLEFLSVLRSHAHEIITDHGTLITPTGAPPLQSAPTSPLQGPGQ